jgi:hypothetical protein
VKTVGAGGPGGMADALAQALKKRKEKVSRSGEYLLLPWFSCLIDVKRMVMC